MIRLVSLTISMAAAGLYFSPALRAVDLGEWNPSLKSVQGGDAHIKIMSSKRFLIIVN